MFQNVHSGRSNTARAIGHASYVLPYSDYTSNIINFIYAHIFSTVSQDPVQTAWPSGDTPIVESRFS